MSFRRKSASPSPPPGKAKDDLEQRDVNRILRIIEQSNSQIATLEGKSVVVFLGGSRVGKSTTIDALLGAKLEYTTGGNVRVAPDSPKISMAQIGEVPGVSTTTIPALYSAARSPYAYLDTRGYFDVRSDPNEDAAASIITELALQHAKEIRIVYLCDYHSFHEGLVGFQRFGQTLRDIVYSADIPVFFLFNKYKPTLMQYDQGFQRKPYAEKERIICEELRKDQANIHRGVETVLKTVAERIKKQIEEEEDDMDAARLEQVIENDEAYIEAQMNSNYDDMLVKSFAKGWFTYIDPCDVISVSGFISKISHFPALNPSDPIFSHKNSERAQFNSKFERQILRLRGILRQKEFALTYQQWWIDACRKAVEAKLEQSKKDAATVAKGESIQELNAFYSEAIQQQYNDNQAVIATLLENIENNRQAVAALKEGEDVADKVTWYEDAKAYWWRDYHVRYNAYRRCPEHPIPYTRIKEQLGKNTVRTEVIKESPDDFDVVYSSVSASGKTGRKATAFLGLLWSAISDPCYGTVIFFAKREDLEWKNIQSLEKQIQRLQQTVIERQTVAQNLNPKLTLSLPDKIRVSQAHFENELKKLAIIESFIKDIVALWALKPQRNPGTEIERFRKFAPVLFREKEAPAVDEFLTYADKVAKLGDFEKTAPTTIDLGKVNFTTLSSDYDAVLPLAARK